MQKMASTEGDKFWKSASKLTSASFLSFRLKSDWEQAGPLYEKAANAYRVSDHSLAFCSPYSLQAA